MYTSVAREACKAEELCGRRESDLQQARLMAAESGVGGSRRTDADHFPGDFQAIIQSIALIRGIDPCTYPIPTNIGCAAPITYPG